HAVVHVERRGIDVGADLEGDLDLHGAVRSRGRAHVEHVLDAVDLVLDRRGDGLLEYLRGCSGVDRAHRDDRRRDFRVLRDRQHAHRGEPGDHDEDREHGREDRPVDEKPRNHVRLPYFFWAEREEDESAGWPPEEAAPADGVPALSEWAGAFLSDLPAASDFPDAASAVSVIFTGTPGGIRESFTTPSTTTRSPGLSPPLMIQPSPDQSPTSSGRCWDLPSASTM